MSSSWISRSHCLSVCLSDEVVDSLVYPKLPLIITFNNNTLYFRVMVKYCQEAYAKGGIRERCPVCECIQARCGPKTLICKSPNDCAAEIFGLLDDCLVFSWRLKGQILHHFDLITTCKIILCTEIRFLNASKRHSLSMFWNMLFMASQCNRRNYPFISFPNDFPSHHLLLPFRTDHFPEEC